MRLLKSRTLLGLLALQLTAAVLPGSNLALCIATDGHTALEFAHTESSCLTDFQRHHSDATAANDLDKHACVDIVLAQTPLCSVSSAGTPALGAAASAFPAPTSLAEPRAVTLSTPSFRFLDRQLSARRTIVLIV